MTRFQGGKPGQKPQEEKNPHEGVKKTGTNELKPEVNEKRIEQEERSG